jgi:hypothetical protein
VHYNGAKAQSCVVQNFCTTSSQSLLSLLCISKKNLFFHFKSYNHTIRAVNFFETFCTCFPKSLGQDPNIKIPIFYFLFFVFASWARNGKFEQFFEKNDLRPLGVNYLKPWQFLFAQISLKTLSSFLSIEYNIKN